MSLAAGHPMRLAVALLLAGCAATPSDPLGSGGAGGGKADEGGTSSSLRQQLHDQIANHTALTYYDARDYLFGVKGQLDLVDGQLECIYTGRLAKPDGTHVAGGFNTEHVWPQSQGAEEEPPRSDLHHIFPVDEAANSARASFPFGEVACKDATQSTCDWEGSGSALQLGALMNGVMTGTFEVRPERRGDVARAKFYFAVRYELPIDEVQETALRAWHEADPPDDRERARDTAIFEIQHNHNPFVVDPDLVGALDDF